VSESGAAPGNGLGAILLGMSGLALAASLLRPAGARRRR
jgi:hypothetical protein